MTRETKFKHLRLHSMQLMDLVYGTQNVEQINRMTFTQLFFMQYVMNRSN